MLGNVLGCLESKSGRKRPPFSQAASYQWQINVPRALSQSVSHRVYDKRRRSVRDSGSHKMRFDGLSLVRREFRLSHAPFDRE